MNCRANVRLSGQDCWRPLPYRRQALQRAPMERLHQADKVCGKVGRMRSPASIRTMRVCVVSMLRKSRASAKQADFGKGAGQLHTGGAAADDRKC